MVGSCVFQWEIAKLFRCISFIVLHYGCSFFDTEEKMQTNVSDEASITVVESIKILMFWL